MEQLKKYELLQDDTVQAFNGATLYRVKALRDFANVTTGALGGYVQSEGNLAQSGNAWVSGNAQVHGYAQVHGDALVSGNAQVHGYAQVSGDAHVRFGIVITTPLVVTGGRYVCTIMPGVGACVGCQDFLPEHLTGANVFRAECAKRGYAVTAEEANLVRALWRVAEITYANS